MFGVNENAEVKVIKDGQEWYSKNFKNYTTKKFSVFHKFQLVVDPTGISKNACVPNGIVVGSSWAKAGYYGFHKDDFTMLVHPKDVEYDGHPVI